MKLGLLKEYNMRNIFLKKSYTKYGGEIIPGPFSRKSKLSISLDQNIYNISSTHLLLRHIKLF